MTDSQSGLAARCVDPRITSRSSRALRNLANPAGRLQLRLARPRCRLRCLRPRQRSLHRHRHRYLDLPRWRGRDHRRRTASSGPLRATTRLREGTRLIRARRRFGKTWKRGGSSGRRNGISWPSSVRPEEILRVDDQWRRRFRAVLFNYLVGTPCSLTGESVFSTRSKHVARAESSFPGLSSSASLA